LVAAALVMGVVVITFGGWFLHQVSRRRRRRKKRRPVFLSVSVVVWVGCRWWGHEKRMVGIGGGGTL